METFKLISEHYSHKTLTVLMVGENNGKYEVRLIEDPFTLYSTFDNYYEALHFAEKEVDNN